MMSYEKLPHLLFHSYKIWLKAFDEFCYELWFNIIHWLHYQHSYWSRNSVCTEDIDVKYLYIYRVRLVYCYKDIPTFRSTSVSFLVSFMIFFFLFYFSHICTWSFYFFLFTTQSLNLYLLLPLSSLPVTLCLCFSPSNRARAIFTQNAIVLLERTLP